jgi:dynamin 1-like protein
LNYFFGGPGAPNGPPGALGAPGGIGDSRMDRTSSGGRGNVNGNGGTRIPPSGFTPREILPDLGSGRRTASRSGLDNQTTAFDMKSLGKHLEAVSLSS